MCYTPMTPPENAAHPEPHTNLAQLLKAVAVAHEIEEAAPGRQDTRHETSDSQRLVAHDHVLVQCRREHHGFSDIPDMHRTFELPEGAEEPGNLDESAPVFLSKKRSSAPVFLPKKSASVFLPTKHSRVPILVSNKHSRAPVFLPEKSAPVFLSKKHSRDALPAPPFHGSHCVLGQSGNVEGH
jgi:hypothetical protein